MDSGSHKTLIHKSALPEGVQLENLGTQKRLLTIAGEYTSMYKVPLKNIVLPEFDRHRKVLEGEAYVYDAPCRYQYILGNNFLATNTRQG